MTTKSTSGMAADIMFGPLRSSKILKQKIKKIFKRKKEASADEDAAKSNKYASVNRHLINKLKG